MSTAARLRTRDVRYGYDLAADGVRLIVNPAEQAVIAHIGEMRTGGRTLREIAAQLTADGVRAKKLRGARTHQAVGKIVRRGSDYDDVRAIPH